MVRTGRGRSMGSRIAGAGALALLSVAGYAASLTLFNSIQFVFGSIAALAAVRILGPGWGIAVAVVGASTTIVTWGHPYAVAIFTLEIAFVGLLARRHDNIALLDALFWLVAGVPLVMLGYAGALGLPGETAVFIGLKQAVNGVFNAVVAGLLLSLLPMLSERLRPRMPRVSFQTTLFYMAAFLALTTAMALVVLDNRTDYRRTLERLSVAMAAAGEYAALSLGGGAVEDLDPQALTASLERMLAVPGTSGMVGDIAIAAVATDGSVRTLLGAPRSFDGGGRVTATGSGLLRWAPTGDIPEMQRSRGSRYIVRLSDPAVPGLSELRVEYAAAPVVDGLERDARQSLQLLAILTGVVFLFAQVVIRQLALPLARLAVYAMDVAPAALSGRHVQAPACRGVVEYDILSNALRALGIRLASETAANRVRPAAGLSRERSAATREH